MGFKQRYHAAKESLLSDASICQANRELFTEFFRYLERKLKRINQRSELDEPSYKTLSKYTFMLRNANRWFKNKSWKLLTKADIERVYDDLEDGKVLTRSGKVLRCRSDYYKKIFKGKPFRMAGKSEIAKEVIEYYKTETDEVRFVTESAFKKLVGVVSNPKHLLLLWLLWDFGENINTLLQLKKSDFRRQSSHANSDPEYLLRFQKEKLKRSRRPRTEPTLYFQTVEYLDTVLADLDDSDEIFQFGYNQAVKIFKAAVNRAGIQCEPNGDFPTFKDLRSGMACHLLRSGWNIDEINARLGHKPGSLTFEKYVTYHALDKNESKKKFCESRESTLSKQLEASQNKTKLQESRLVSMNEKIVTLQTDLSNLKKAVCRLLARQGLLQIDPFQHETDDLSYNFADGELVIR